LDDSGEEMWEQDPSVRAQIQEARSAYEAGDYVTLDEYIAQLKKAEQAAKPLFSFRHQSQLQD
jgi:hypothetical protein